MAWPVLVALDQLLNTLVGWVVGGRTDPDETLSSRAAKRRQQDKAARHLCDALDYLDEGHCPHSVEPDRGGPDESWCSVPSSPYWPPGAPRPDRPTTDASTPSGRTPKPASSSPGSPARPIGQIPRLGRRRRARPRPRPPRPSGDTG